MKLTGKQKARGFKTNSETVTEMMDFSKFGALAQVFIMDAIGKHAKAVAKMDLKKIDPKEWTFISAEAWIGVAKEIEEKLKVHYKDK